MEARTREEPAVPKSKPPFHVALSKDLQMLLRKGESKRMLPKIKHTRNLCIEGTYNNEC